MSWMIHSSYYHSCNLRSDHIVGDSVCDVFICIAGQKIEKIMVDFVEIFAMLPAIIEASSCNLWKLAGAVETLRSEWIRWTCVYRPIRI